jgi:hypothetical protein
MSIFERLSLQILKIYHVTIGASLSTGMSPTTEKMVPVKSYNNLEKYEHPCGVYNLNPDGQVLLQETLPIRNLWSWRATLVTAGNHQQ